ncbi:MAG: rhomboid family intramembrane serine protease [Nostoc sp. ChiQUE02]|uniref:rhomboid family intramembrane serine protease n=1 Tax=Nostoc sp. ChiQUE02 TaxID=3075377 RepID=UPI002AD533E0|nr:rhomboid family intramembrane serine protease [Nostoc sp. ChiQUE02]MDZ8228830.1 rhomboid family intramembrane serine protease [Nostoc sp. ChiQUE02]
MIPISDNIRCRSKPIINYWLIGINLAVFLWELKLEFSGELGYFISSWGVIPAQISGAVTNALFFNSAALIIVILRVFSLISGIFMHGSFSQILGNLLFLWVFGKTVENILGHRRYLGLYLAAGAIASFVQILAEPSLAVPLIGANGAIAAILGAYIIKFPKAKIYTILPLIILYIPIELPAFFYIFWWFVQQLFYGIGSLNIPPLGVNQSGVVFVGQVVGSLIGAVFMRLKK